MLCMRKKKKKSSFFSRLSKFIKMMVFLFCGVLALGYFLDPEYSYIVKVSKFFHIPGEYYTTWPCMIGPGLCDRPRCKGISMTMSNASAIDGPSSYYCIGKVENIPEHNRNKIYSF